MEDNQIREKIVRGTEALFTKYGVRSISMDDIARHLSVSKKTLYQHFEDKEELVMLATQAHIERLMVEFDIARDLSTDAIDQLIRVSTCLRKTIREINPSLLYDLEKYHPRAWNAWLESKQRFMRDSVIRNLRWGVDEGYFRSDLDFEVLATMRMELAQLAFDDRVFPPARFKMASVHDQLFEHFVHGLFTDKGRQRYMQCKENQIEISNP